MIKKTVLIILVFLFAIMGLYAADDGDVITDPGQDTETPKLTVTLSIDPEYYAGFTSKELADGENVTDFLHNDPLDLSNKEGFKSEDEVWASVETNQGYNTTVTIAWTNLTDSNNTIPLSVKTPTSTEDKFQIGDFNNSSITFENNDVAVAGGYTITENLDAGKIRARVYSYPIEISANETEYVKAPNGTYNASIYMILDVEV